ncbi:hypothetical protein [Paenibacillus sp. cl141a]|nr:hypothetical protein [Paenibacillus sp. cl141a]
MKKTSLSMALKLVFYVFPAYPLTDGQQRYAAVRRSVPQTDSRG